MSQRLLLALPLLALLGCPPPDDKPDDTGPGTVDCDDADGDGYCADEDCDDTDPDVNPGVDEESLGPDDLDNDCDGFVDECDEADPSITWHSEEVCDGVDNDCDGEIDEDLGETWYPDRDGDGYGDRAQPTSSCDPDAGLVADGTDCDDTDAAVHPGAMEQCNGLDDDCDVTTTEDGLVTVEGVGNQASIQAALGKADEGGTVRVCAGTWAEALIVARGVTLEAPAGPDLTALVGDKTAAVVHVHAGSVTLRGFTISGGVGTDISSESETLGGGGVLGWNADELLIEDCVVTGNQADYGGGVLGPSEGLLTIRDSVISSNHASAAGGGVYLMEGVMERVELFDNSSATSGGGIYHYENTLTLTDCTLTDNAATYGGALRAFNDTIEASGTVLEGNQAEYGGGAYVRNDAVVSGLEIRDNSGDRGAGVYCREDCTLTDSTLSGNTATSYGGGMMCRDGVAVLQRVTIDASTASGGAGILQDGCDLQLEAVTIQGGTASYGGGVYMVDSQLDADADVLISGNVAETAGGGAYVYSNSSWDGGVVQANEAGSGAGMYLYGIGVLDGVQLRDNLATEWGGGLMVVSESDLQDVVLDGNSANYGGGLYVYGTGSIRMDGATVTHNTATERGGGVRVSAGILDITASDFGDAKVDNGPDDIYAGGTAYTGLGVVKLLSCTGSDGCS
jgi:hypothetical protein